MTTATLAGVIEGPDLEPPLHEVVAHHLQILNEALPHADQPVHVLQLRLWQSQATGGQQGPGR